MYTTEATATILIWIVPTLVVAYIVWADDDKWKF